jgi:L,D-transpeptidase catalytic domain
MPNRSRAAGDQPPTQASPERVEHLSDELASSTWAFLVRDAVARAAPDGRAPAVARLSSVSQSAREVVLVLARCATRDSEWLHVRLPVRPNGSTGWIRRNAAGELREVRRALVVDRAALTARLLRDGSEELWSGPIGIGAPGWPTPAGRFYVRVRYVPQREHPLYGSFAFRTSGCVDRVPWPGADFVAVHGTNRPDLLPGHVSKGCIRVLDQDVLELRKLLPIGAPVRIV